MDPQGPSQPPLDQVYNTQGNPADQSPQEQRSSSSNASSNSASLLDSRQNGDIPVPSTHQESATPSSLGYGARDSSKDNENISPSTTSPTTNSNNEGEQMRAAGEGDIYKAKFNKTGFGEQDDLASDLNRKKAEQASMREKVKEERSEKVDVGGALGGREGVGLVGSASLNGGRD
ncbi:hypothetical protein MMC14_008910 [Varicellaria rhodocarpa]|nr:hypothetical protein [Varicellaria rhodocarpa]